MRAANMPRRTAFAANFFNSTLFCSFNRRLIGLALVIIIMLVGIYPNREEPHKADDQDADGKQNHLHRCDLIPCSKRPRLACSTSAALSSIPDTDSK
jgi:hypothetical protein